MTRKINYYILNGSGFKKVLQHSHWELIVALLARLAPMCVAAQRLSKFTDREVLSGRAEVQPHQARAIARVLGEAKPEDIDAVKEGIGRPFWDAGRVIREVRSTARLFGRAGEVRVGA